MKKPLLFGISLAVMLSVAVSATGITKLLTNGDFSDGLKNWRAWYYCGGGIPGYTGGDFSTNVVYDSELDSNVLEYKRENSQGFGGDVVVSQWLRQLNVNLDECPELYVEADVKVISESMFGDGGIIRTFFPAYIQVYYHDARGHVWRWKHGFSLSGNQDKDYDVVTINEWYHYVSPNILLDIDPILPRPLKLSSFQLGGAGADFQGRFDNVKLYCGPKIPPISACIDIDPDTLRTKSNSKWITAHIELPEGYEAKDINIDTVLLNINGRTVPAVTDEKYGFVKSEESYLTDQACEEGVLERMVRFEASKVKKLLSMYIGVYNIEITITGELFDGTFFEGSDIIRAIKQGIKIKI